MMKRFAILTAAAMMAYTVLADFPVHSNSKSIDINKLRTDFTDFRWTWNGFEDQTNTFSFYQGTNAVSLAGLSFLFRVEGRNSGGSNVLYVAVASADITTTTNSIGFSVSRTNVPPSGDYQAQILAYDTGATNYTRNFGRGTISAEESLYDSDPSAFPYPAVTVDLGDLNNVTLNSEADNDVLVYLNGVWTNVPQSTILASYATTAYVDAATGSVDIVRQADIANFATDSELASQSNNITTAYGSAIVSATNSTTDIVRTADIANFATDSELVAATNSATDLVRTADIANFATDSELIAATNSATDLVRTADLATVAGTNGLDQVLNNGSVLTGTRTISSDGGIRFLTSTLSSTIRLQRTDNDAYLDIGPYSSLLMNGTSSVARTLLGGATTTTAEVVVFDNEDLVQIRSALDVQGNMSMSGGFISQLGDGSLTNDAAAYGQVIAATNSTTDLVRTADIANFATDSELIAATNTSDIIRQVALTSATNGLLRNVVEDTTPQLGGNLDMNGKWVSGDGDSEGIFVSSSGLVGINNPNPPATLSICDDTGYGNVKMRIARDCNSNEYTEIIDYSPTQMGILKTGSTSSLIDIAPTVTNKSGDCSFRFFRQTDTTGPVYFNIYRGNNSSTVEHSIYGNANTVLASSYNLGVGISPTAKLHVGGNILATAGITGTAVVASSSLGVRTTSPTEDAQVNGDFRANHISVNTAANTNCISAKVTGGNIEFLQGLGSDDDSCVLIGTDASENGRILMYDGSGVEKNKINSSGDSYLLGGNVGIGDGTPTSPLDVYSATNWSGGTIAISSPTDFVRQWFQLAATDTRPLASGVGGVITLKGVYDGVGSTTDFGSIQGYKENATDGHYGGGLRFYSRANGSTLANTLTLQPDGSLHAAGNVGIRTNTPALPLHVTVGTGSGATPFDTAGVFIDGQTDSHLYMIGATNGNAAVLMGDTADTWEGGILYDNNTELLKFYANSILGGWFEDDGDLNMNVHNVVNTSDAMAKTNVVNLASGAIDKVKLLRPVTFEYKDVPNVTRTGLIAQEVESVIPEAVNVAYDGTKGLIYTEMIPYLIKAIQDQQAQIDALTTRIEALEKR